MSLPAFPRFLLLLSGIALSLSSGYPEKPLRVTYKKSEAGNHYTFFHQDGFLFSFDTTRPSREDKTVFLCIAGAFTRLEDGKIDGFYMKNGKAFNSKKVNHGIGGALVIRNGKIDIPDTKKGKIFNDSLIQVLKNQKASVFQQIKIVSEGIASGFKDESLFQRRAIIIDKAGNAAVVESSKPMTLKQFSSDLAALGAQQALYTDMGGWDEGWFRDEKNYPVTIGKILTSTSRQCNWVTLRRLKKNVK